MGPLPTLRGDIRMIWFSCFNDPQQAPPVAYCRRCGAELYRYDEFDPDWPLCPECQPRTEEDEEHE